MELSRQWKVAAFLCAALSPALGFAKEPCTHGIRFEGTVTDPSGSAITGAQVQVGDQEKTTTDETGSFVLPCVPASIGTITAQAEGFTSGTAGADGRPGGVAHINIQLAIAQVQTNVQVTADPTAMDGDNGTGTRTLSTQDIQQLPDDPDDLLLQLQLLASTGGGASSSATIVVDGFQNASAMSPKGSIASIRINPDPFSPEYERPSSQGGRVEISTKPGADLFHGALFLTDSDGSFNATDPFSVTTTPAGKRRYGLARTCPQALLA
jgi:Carboxypeptidase regulatory-like domain